MLIKHESEDFMVTACHFEPCISWFCTTMAEWLRGTREGSTHLHIHSVSAPTVADLEPTGAREGNGACWASLVPQVQSLEPT